MVNAYVSKNRLLLCIFEAELVINSAKIHLEAVCYGDLPDVQSSEYLLATPYCLVESTVSGSQLQNPQAIGLKLGYGQYTLLSRNGFRIGNTA